MRAAMNCSERRPAYRETRALMNYSYSSLALCAVMAALVLPGCTDQKPTDAAAPSPTSSAAPAATPGASAPASAASAATPPGPPVSVTTVKAEARDMAVNLRTTGTVFPLASVDVKAQTSSVVTKMHINGGQFVRAGDPLFTLDGRAEEANLAKARAQLAKDQATLADTQRQLKRAQELLAQNFVAKSAVDTAQAAVDAASATLQSDQAAIDAAKVALSYTQITAPLSGRAGALSVQAKVDRQLPGLVERRHHAEIQRVGIPMEMPLELDELRAAGGRARHGDFAGHL